MIKDILSESLTHILALKNYNNWILENIKPAIGEKILEIGCGVGAIINCIPKENREIWGVDINYKFIKYLKSRFFKNKNMRFIKADVMDLTKKLKKNYFDSILMINVLEHIKDDDKAIKIIKKLLKKNGKVGILVPAFQFLYGPLDKNVGHFRRYSKKRLIELLTKNGFKIEKIYYMNFLGFWGWLLNVRILKRGDTPKFQSRFFDKFIVPILMNIEKFIKPVVGQSIIAIASKK